MDNYHFEEELNASGGRLVLRVEVGEVVIQTHDLRQVVVDAETREMDVTVERREDTVFVNVERREDGRGGFRSAGRLAGSGGPHAEVKVVLPRACIVDARVITGSLQVRQVEAPVTTRVTAGSTRLDEINGPVDASTVSGRIIYRGMLADAQHSFKTTTGQLELHLSREPNARVDIQTLTGRIDCTFPLTNKQSKRSVTGGRLLGTLGTGAGQIRGRVTTGSLALKAL